jgi:hypothetical protein
MTVSSHNLEFLGEFFDCNERRTQTNGNEIIVDVNECANLLRNEWSHAAKFNTLYA